MLTRAGKYVQELFPDMIAEPEVHRESQQTLRRAAAVETIRRNRTDATQDLSFGARPFILCGLPIRRLPAGTLTYTRRNGRFYLEVVGHPQYGVPFGQDRLVLLWLATSAVRQQNPVVRFESGAQILIEWGLPLNGKHYERLGDAFKRVFGSTVFFGTKDERRGSEVWSGDRTHFFDHMRVWFRDEELRDVDEGNTVILSQPFWEELKNHPIPIETEVIRILAHNPGCLDLYTWLSWRCYKAKGPERIPLFGPQGLMNQLGVQEYARERKFRERLNAWLKLICLYWPECPAVLAKNGSFLVLDNAVAVRATNSSNQRISTI
jgi:hypothetical protein